MTGSWRSAVCRGADACIDAVGTRGRQPGKPGFAVDRVKVGDLHGNGPAACIAARRSLLQEFRHGFVVRRFMAVISTRCRSFGDQPRPDASDGPDPRQRYLPLLLDRIREGRIDPSFVVTHPRRARRRPRTLQDLSRKERTGCIKVVLSRNRTSFEAARFRTKTATHYPEKGRNAQSSSMA